ncbi:hypothetical protein Q5424_18760 [Conexibacter sp. JD483]|uniref:hypothetical protein n=1 Tax=unclassified Conexibacter TaxID=2627773 RepID=UPI002723AF04|nr:MULTISPECIES: hypothetical protein [unclassified Conexibacter]MDO8186363.1 hypothetical protein [Conexibacter sp. CPCC 205706]MDO8199762.1 hypothetical protein [Conexibacter sp. CPCC 205762]MDR9371145.1 hypothetical protein [Conexibacter sp. JD483]
MSRSRPDQPPPRRALARELALLALGAVVLAVLMHWPLVLHLGDDVAKDLGDPLSQSWQVAWGGHALAHQPLRFFDANQYYPYRDTLAFSDALVGYAPAGLFGSGPHAAIARYDLLYLFAYALAFAGTYLLARTLGASPGAAIVAGVAFAYTPWRLEQAGHLHVISSGGIPLTLALLVRGWKRRSAPLLLLGWIVASWQLSLGWTLGLQLAYLLLALALVLLVLAWRAGDAHRPAAALARARAALTAPANRRLVAATVTGIALFALVGLVLGRIYLRVADSFPSARRGPEIVAAYSGGPLEFLAAGRDSLVWADATAPFRDDLAAVAEQSLFPGLAIVVLAVLGAGWGLWSRRLRIGLAATAAICAILSLGYANADLRFLYPYGWLSALPGWDAIRTPGRLMTLTTLALALLAAAGTQRLQRRWRWAALPLALLVLVEGSAFSLDGGRLSGPPHPAVPTPPPGLAAATAPLLQLPLEAEDNRRYLLWSTAGFPRMVNGRSSTIPPKFAALGPRIAGFPDASSVARLRALGVRTVVLHRDRIAGTPWAGWERRPWRALGISRELRDGVVLFRIPASQR